MEDFEVNTVVENALISSAINEAQRLLCEALETFGAGEWRQSNSAITAAHNLISGLERQVADRWIDQTAGHAIEMHQLLEKQLRDPSEEKGPSTDDN